MTQWSPEQLSKVQTAGFETIVGLTNKALDGFEQLVKLNIQTMKTSVAAAQEGTKKVLSVKDPQEFVELQMEAFQPAADNVLEYRRQLTDILAATRVEFEKVAEAQYTTGMGQLQGPIEGAVSNAPSGSTTPLAAWQEAIKAITTLYESMQTTAKQAVQVAESSFNSAAEAASQGARRRTAQASQEAAK